jgi:hypothetical protein
MSLGEHHLALETRDSPLALHKFLVKLLSLLLFKLQQLLELLIAFFLLDKQLLLLLKKLITKPNLTKQYLNICLRIFAHAI